MSPRTKEQFEQMRRHSRRRILDAALELFANQGYHPTTVDQIARQAGVSKGLIYHHFSSKEELLQAIIQSTFQIFDQIISESATTSSAVERITKLIETSFDVLQTSRHYWTLIFQLFLQPAVLKQFGNPLRDYYQQFVAKMGHDFSEMGIAEPEMEARILGAILDGISLHSILMADYPLDRVKKVLLDRYTKE